MPQKRARAIVVGAGPGGLTAAVSLQRAGHQVVVCEQAARFPAVGFGLTLWPNATSALDAIGLLPRLATIGRPLTAIAMKDWRGRTLFQDSLLHPRWGPRFPSFVVLRAELVDVLAAAFADAIMFGTRVVGVKQEADLVVAQLADGHELAGDLLVGADGLHSAIRPALIGQRAPLRNAGYVVWRGIADAPCEASTGTTWMGPAKQFGLFPLTARRAYWFAASKAAGAAGPARDILDAAFADAPHPIPRFIAQTSDAAILLTPICDRSPLRRWSFGRCTLLGDAAHPATPTLGQGACQAIEDGVTLGACLAADKDPVSALRRYEVKRVVRANGFVLEARRLGKLGQWESPLPCWWRDRLIGAMPAAIRRKQLARMFEFAI